MNESPDPHPKAKIVRVVDPLSFCPECGSDAKVTVTTRENGITFTKTGEKARVGICGECRIMWSERTPLGQEMRGEVGGGRKRTSISVPGMATRPRSDERVGLLESSRPAGPLQGPHTVTTAGPTATDRLELLHYERCTVLECPECDRIQAVWDRRWAKGIGAL